MSHCCRPQLDKLQSVNPSVHLSVCSLRPGVAGGVGHPSVGTSTTEVSVLPCRHSPLFGAPPRSGTSWLVRQWQPCTQIPSVEVGGSFLWTVPVSRVSSMRWMSSCARGFPVFIGKSSAAPTPAWLPTQSLRRHLPCEAQRRAHFQRGCAAFTNRGKIFLPFLQRAGNTTSFKGILKLFLQLPVKRQLQTVY